MQVEFDINELGRLARNRDVSVYKVMTEFLDEYVTINPNIIYDLQVAMQDQESLFRCIDCGYWLDKTERHPEDAGYCTQCFEENHA